MSNDIIFGAVAVIVDSVAWALPTVIQIKLLQSF